MLCSKSITKKRVALSVLSVFRLINHGVKPSYESQLIVTKWSLPKEEFTSSLKALTARYKLHRLHLRTDYDHTSVWMGSKGVSGKCAITTCGFDAACLLQKKYSSLFNATAQLMSRYCGKVG